MFETPNYGSRQISTPRLLASTDAIFNADEPPTLRIKTRSEGQQGPVRAAGLWNWLGMVAVMWGR